MDRKAEATLLSFSRSAGLLVTIFIASLRISAVDAEDQKCYACSSGDYLSKWSHMLENRPMYLAHKPFYSNDSCDSLVGALPIVPCDNSVCIKVVIEPPKAIRTVCEEGPVIIRDCWSRVVSHGAFKDKPLSSKPVRLVSPEDLNRTVGLVYTCNGYLCNVAISQNAWHSTLSLLALWIAFNW